MMIQKVLQKQKKIEKVTREFDKQDDKKVDNLKSKFDELFPV